MMEDSFTDQSFGQKPINRVKIKFEDTKTGEISHLSLNDSSSKEASLRGSRLSQHYMNVSDKKQLESIGSESFRTNQIGDDEEETHIAKLIVSIAASFPLGK